MWRQEERAHVHIAWLLLFNFVPVLTPVLCRAVLSCCPGDHPIASDRLKRYLAIGASLANARAHKVCAAFCSASQQWRCKTHTRTLPDSIRPELPVANSHPCRTQPQRSSCPRGGFTHPSPCPPVTTHACMCAGHGRRPACCPERRRGLPLMCRGGAAARDLPVGSRRRRRLEGRAAGGAG